MRYYLVIIVIKEKLIKTDKNLIKAEKLIKTDNNLFLFMELMLS